MVQLDTTLDYVSSSQRVAIVALLDYYSSKSSFEDGVNYLKKLDQNTKSYHGSGSLHFQADKRGRT